MEIHPPHRPITSIKEFLKELVTITAGILIALSLEGILEWHHHRELAHEARANILSEIRENQRELTKEQQDLVKMQQQVKAIIDIVHQLQASRKTQISQLGYIWSLAELHSTSWNTAGATGAISYMPYSEVKTFTALYDLQRDFEALQQRGFESSVAVEGLGVLLERKPETLTDAELSDAERRLGTARANVTAMRQLAAPLLERYNEALKGNKE